MTWKNRPELTENLKALIETTSSNNNNATTNDSQSIECNHVNSVTEISRMNSSSENLLNEESDMIMHNTMDSLEITDEPELISSSYDNSYIPQVFSDMHMNNMNSQMLLSASYDHFLNDD